MMCSIYDAISNDKIARTKIVKMEGDILVLSNANKEVQTLLDLSRQFKLVTDSGEYAGNIKPLRVSHSYITVQLSNINQPEKRRYMRIGCSLNAQVFISSFGEMINCVIKELAFGSCIIECSERLYTDEETTVQFNFNLSSLALNGVIKFERQKEQEEDDIWFNGYEYMISFEESNNLERAYDDLYTVLLTMMRNNRSKSITGEKE